MASDRDVPSDLPERKRHAPTRMDKTGRGNGQAGPQHQPHEQHAAPKEGGDQAWQKPSRSRSAHRSADGGSSVRRQHTGEKGCPKTGRPFFYWPKIIKP